MSRPPALSRRLLRRLPLGARRAEIERDLDDVYARHLARQGRRAAARRYWKETLALIRWRIAPRRELSLHGVVHDLPPGADHLLECKS